MKAHCTQSETALVLSELRHRRLAAGERLLALIPSLAEGALQSADLGFRARLAYVAADLRLESQPRVARIRQRLAFWLARAGGWARAMEAMAPDEAERFGETMAHCEVSLRGLSPAGWVDAVRRVFSAAGAPPPGEIPAEPELSLHAGGTGWDGFTFDPAALLLQVPSPLAPPAGDVLRVAIDPAGAPGEICLARATVVAVRRPAEASPGAPAGFTLALDAASDDAAAILSVRCPPPGGSSRRAAPRYGVVAGARLSDPGEDLEYASEDEFLRDYLTNLSHGGAFVRTAQPRRVGERVQLHVRLPGRPMLAIPATVVHRSERGVGLQFELTPGVEAALSAAVAGLAARPHRVLVVDDDALARRVLSDAFTARGVEAVTAADGDAGLHAILEQLLALDAVVTDLEMPGLSGDALVSAVRRAGGESELVLVVVSASASDPAVRARLGAAGADAVIPKGAGPAAVVSAVEEALLRRSAALGPPPRAANPEPARAAGA